MPPKQKEPLDFGQIPNMLGTTIARELRFDRDEGVRKAIQQAVREELEQGRTEVEAQQVITGQWKRWKPIADLYPGMSTEQFFLTSRYLLPILEESAELKQPKADALPPRRQPQISLPKKLSKGFSTAEPEPRWQKRRTTVWRGRETSRLTTDVSIGRYDPSQKPVYSAEDQAFIDAFMAKPEDAVTIEDIKQFNAIERKYA